MLSFPNVTFAGQGHVWEADGKHSGLGLIMMLLIVPLLRKAKAGAGRAFLDHAPRLPPSEYPAKASQRKSQRDDEGEGIH